MKKLIITLSSIVVLLTIGLIVYLSLKANLKSTYTSADTKYLTLSPQGQVSFVLDGKNKTYDATEIIEEKLSKDDFYKLGNEGGKYRYKVIVYKMQEKVIVYKYTLQE